MRSTKTLLLPFIILLSAFYCNAQEHEWIAPEGKIINYRTLTWQDFPGKPDKDEPAEAGAAVRPSIYFNADSGEYLPNDRLTYKFHVKCAFQSVAWVKEIVLKDRTYFYLNHEQEHYDIALTYANKLKADLSGRDYSAKNYEKEIDDIYQDLMKKYEQTQDDYDGQSNHSLIKEMQTLWDMRIKKCLENNTIEYYSSPESVVKTVHYLGQPVKRIVGEPAVQFATRCRPIYSEFSDELAGKIIETKEWSADKAVIAFYSQQYTKTIEDEAPKACTRLLGEVFLTKDKINYKRVLIDTFTNEERPTKIVATFLANVDSDSYKELIVITATDRKDKEASGTQYTVKVYDNIFPNIFPARLKRLDDISAKLEGGFEGMINGKPSKAKHRSQKDIEDELKKMGINNSTNH